MNEAQTLTWARFVTPNFTFDAFAPDEAEARAMLYRAWSSHARKTGADAAYLLRHEDDVEIQVVRAGTVLRDRQEFN